MNKILAMALTLISTMGHAVLYTKTEIDSELQRLDLHNSSQNYLHQYFTTDQPMAVIDQLLSSKMTPLHREYIFNQILTEISLQPQQAFHQPFVDLMKTYQHEASQMALEGPFPEAVFNLNGKAHGIENIWLAKATEQQLNQLLKRNLPQAVELMGNILAAPTNQQRPQWLGAKNSMAALPANELQALGQYLKDEIAINTGFDRLIGHVGLLNADLQLINKALSSDQQAVGEYTLRQLPMYVDPGTAEATLIQATAIPKLHMYSLSLLGPYTHSIQVQDLLLNKLQQQNSASAAAYALSQANDSALFERMSKQYLKSSNEHERNHILMSLKLNQSLGAKQAMTVLVRHLDPNSKAVQWLLSFEGDLQ